MDHRAAPVSESVVIVEPEVDPSGRPYDARELMQQCVEETRGYLDDLGQPLPTLGSQRRVYWMVGAVVLLILAGGGFGVVELTQSDAVARSAARAVALQEQETCARRQQVVMQAIAQYTQDHQQPPADLSMLRPPLLKVPPVDPASGVPYQYAREGNSVRLSCAKHPLPPDMAAH